MGLGLIVLICAILIAIGVWKLDELYGLIMVGALVLLFTTIIFSCVYIGSIGEVAELDAFYSSTKYTYANVITESEDIEINLPAEEDNLISATGLTYFRLATNVGGSIRAFGSAIEKYNKGLFRLIYYNNNWFLDSFHKDVPEHLKPIILKLE